MPAHIAVQNLASKPLPYSNAFVKAPAIHAWQRGWPATTPALLDMKRDGRLVRIQARYGFDKGAGARRP